MQNKIVYILVSFLSLYASNLYADALPVTKEEILTVKTDDFVLGSKDAKVVIFEYSSFACPHCAMFHKQTFPDVKKNYIDTGKIRYVFRDFPTNQPSAFASLLVKCADDRKLNFMEMLFESQGVWAFTFDYREKLKNIAKLGGISESDFDKCMTNDAVKDNMLKSAYSASKVLGIHATPNFFINGTKVDGALPYKQFAERIDQALSPPKAKAKK